ncbi:YbfB/YjiJ family MFS transporter [Bacillus sp. JJ1566]|uniref:YbfB/YjiJ family MFS transporter n=1 Tax=Bacillus sp. JJ1566 TaxID=3122961 RepID=UPI002FFF2D3B
MNRKSLELILLSFFTLAIVMGIGRFAYTPLFPYMDNLSSKAAGWLASANYTGYFLGAFLVKSIHPTRQRFLFYLWTNIVTTILMGVTMSFSIWLLLRFISGVTSAIVFVYISGWISQVVHNYEGKNRNGIIFGGVGFGIFLSGILVPLLMPISNWRVIWITLGLISIVFTLIFYRFLPESNQKLHSPHKKNLTDSKRSVLGLYICYFCEGFGYIIFGTFIVAKLSSNDALPISPSIIWAITGLAAIPSCLFWTWLRNRISLTRALSIAYIVQLTAIVFNTISSSLIFTILSGIGFGGTFIGITVLSFEMARKLRPDAPQQHIAGITAVYGIGQLLGPIATSFLHPDVSYIPSFLLSAVVILVGLVTSLISDKISNIKVNESH